MLQPRGPAAAGGGEARQEVPAQPAGHLRQEGGGVHSLPACGGAVRPDPGARAGADHLLVVPQEREGHLHVLVPVQGARLHAGVPQLALLPGNQAAGDGMRQGRFASR